jgi:hypothetical protein
MLRTLATSAPRSAWWLLVVLGAATGVALVETTPDPTPSAAAPPLSRVGRCGRARIAPPPAPEVAKPAPLSAGDIEQMVVAKRDTLQRCYERSLKADGPSEETMADSKITGDMSSGLARCTSETIESWTFRPSPSGLTATFTVVLSAD